jgi:hypothetical protein
MGRFRTHIPSMATIVRCNCGAEYKRTETKFLLPLEASWESTHVPSFELVKRPDSKPI